mmetsp:Transcript_33244/g.130850  ORF Transcript_33244/g.130850 Transcript_33244/m.130850 type:complete len:83 (+) Transcript_33244:540-788(+)
MGSKNETRALFFLSESMCFCPALVRFSSLLRLDNGVWSILSPRRGVDRWVFYEGDGVWTDLLRLGELSPSEELMEGWRRMSR